MIRASIVETEKPKRPRLWAVVRWNDGRRCWDLFHLSESESVSRADLESMRSAPTEHILVTIPGSDDALTEAKLREAAEKFLYTPTTNEVDRLIAVVKSLGVLEDGG